MALLVSMRRGAAAALILVAAALPGAADAVEVDAATGLAATELDRLCPGAVAQLQQRLAGAWADRREPGRVAVVMTVGASGIATAAVSNLEGDYRDPVRRALRSLPCRAASGRPERVSLVLVFTPEPDPRPALAVRPGARPVPASVPPR